MIFEGKNQKRTEFSFLQFNNYWLLYVQDNLMIQFKASVSMGRNIQGLSVSLDVHECNEILRFSFSDIVFCSFAVQICLIFFFFCCSIIPANFFQLAPCLFNFVFSVIIYLTTVCNDMYNIVQIASKISQYHCE